MQNFKMTLLYKKVKFDQMYGSKMKKNIYRQFTLVIARAKRCLSPIKTSTCFFGRVHAYLMQQTVRQIQFLLFTSNRATVIKNQVLIRALACAYVFNKTDALLKLTNGFKFQIIKVL